MIRMPETVEATGRTLEEAKMAAAGMLGVAVEDCEFEVSEEGSKGLFAKTNYRVTARLRTVKETPQPRTERAPRTPKKEKEKVTKAVVEAEPATAEEGDEEGQEYEATQADAEAAIEMLEGFFKAGKLALTPELDGIGGKYVNVSLSGEDVEGLTAEKGAVLDSLQYLANAMFGRSHGPGPRLTLDAGSYRSGRATALEKLANEVATAVRSRNQEAVLDALPAHERRIIHNALKDFDGVETYSEGEEPLRRVVITPKK
jgi:spoIIIJ-associated protein